MTEHNAFGDGSGGYSSGTSATGLKDRASQTANEATNASKRVGSTVKEGAVEVTHEVKGQAKTLLSNVGEQVRDQASTQQQRAASGLRSVGENLTSMANGQQSSGIANRVVNQVAERANSVAGWLESREPADVLDEVKSFARRRPGAFLAIAAGAGVVVGRLVRATGSAAKDKAESDATTESLYTTTGTEYADRDYSDLGVTGTGVSTAAATGDTFAAPGYAGDGSYDATGDSAVGYPENGSSRA